MMLLVKFCGASSETVQHDLLHCLLYIHSRDITIHALPPRYVTIPVLLNGDPTLPSTVNSTMFFNSSKINYSFKSLWFALGRDQNILSVSVSVSLFPSLHLHARAHTHTHACTDTHKHMLISKYTQ